MKPLFFKKCRRKAAEERSHKHPWRFCLWLVCLPAAGALTLAARALPAFAEWYAVRVYPLLAQPINFLTGLLPFSMMEVLCTALLAALPVLFVLLVARLVRLPDAKSRLRCAGRTLAKLACIASAALLAFVLLCGVNYHRYTYAQHSGLPVQKATVAELEALCWNGTLKAVVDASTGEELPMTADAAGVHFVLGDTTAVLLYKA